VFATKELVHVAAKVWPDGHYRLFVASTESGPASPISFPS
jgi:hypothetical protein